MRGASEKHEGLEPEFDLDFDTWDWKQLAESDYERQINRHEAAFPCYFDQFREIVEYMKPHEMWARTAAEMRFVWVNGNVRTSLDFVRIEHEHLLPAGIKVQLTTEIDGQEFWSFWASCSEFCVLPHREYLPARIVFSRHLEYMPLTSTVLLVLLRRGSGGYDTIEKRAHTLWVG